MVRVIASAIRTYELGAGISWMKQDLTLAPFNQSNLHTVGVEQVLSLNVLNFYPA